MTEWWRHAVIYQIYPRSFQDSNGDGVGDLKGILARLEYLAWLGVDAVWLSPIYPSPMADFGYDVADFTDVDPRFGTLADFDVLVGKAHALGLRIILDFVPNHTSEDHPWFIESRGSRDNPKRDWFVWRDAGPNGAPPNNWLSEFGGAAWTWDERTSQYYYHAFLPAQPDLNWRNPDVREAMYEAMRFWLKRGVDGFRLDTIEHLIEDDALRDNPPNPDWTPDLPPAQSLRRLYTSDRPEIAAVLRGMRQAVDAFGERVLVGETYLPLDRVVTYYGHGIHLPFNFQLIGAPWRAGVLAALIRRYEELLPPGAQPNWVLGNHDRSRIASRVGPAQAGVAAMLLLTLRGTPTMYYGDELAMLDVNIPADRVQDPWGMNVPGFGVGRDPVRTPMAWSPAANGGFTTGDPWLPLHADYATRNVEVHGRDQSSLLSLYRQLLALRRSCDALREGPYGAIGHDGDVLYYERLGRTSRLRIVLNLSAAGAVHAVPGPGRVKVSTIAGRAGEQCRQALSLAANEGVIIAFD